MRQNHSLLKEGLRFDRTKTPTSPENLRGGAISPKAPCQQTRTAAVPNRSQIVPYLGASSDYIRESPHKPSSV